MIAQAGTTRALGLLPVEAWRTFGRRLAGAGWLLWDEPGQTVRLGPRVAAWGSADLSALRELWRMLPSSANIGRGDAENSAMTSANAAHPVFEPILAELSDGTAVAVS